MKIALIGLGNIGKDLAKKLIKENHFVTATTNSVAKLKSLSGIAQKSYLMKGDDQNSMKLLIEENDAIILITSSNGSEEIDPTLLKTAQTIKHTASSISTPKILIYTSKSSIYGDHQGQWVDESSPLNAKDDDAKIIIETENELFSLKNLNWKVTILRLAQIYGPHRTIIEIFKSYYKDIIPGHGNYYTNMVHIQDATNSIIYVLDHGIEGIFNIADDVHPTREEFAKILCKKTNLKLPSYDPKLADFPDYNKRVSNFRIKEKGFQFTYPKRFF